MSYQKQGFYAGGELYASQLEAMEDGIINAEKLAMEGAAGAANMEKGTKEGATQQLPNGVADGFFFAEYNDDGTIKKHKNENAYASDSYLKDLIDNKGKIPYGATGDFSSSFGGKSAAIGRRAFACGTTTIAKGSYSFAAGENTVALGNSSFAEGMQTTSVGYAAHAQNGLTLAQGDSSHAQNYITKAIGDYSTATGVETVAEGIASFTAGRGTKATIDSQMVIGRYNDNMRALFEVGNGTSNEDRKTAFAIFEDGTVWVSKAPTANNHVVRLGDLSAVINNDISNIGLKKTLNQGASVSQKQASASADASAAFNQGKATNVLTFAAGTNTEASGYGATAFGVNTVSKNAYGFTTGEGTQTGLDCQTVVGKYNLGTQGLFEVGCGTVNNRFNGLAVHPDGYLIIRNAKGEYYNLNIILDKLGGWVAEAKI
jgi:hypothetical protein